MHVILHGMRVVKTEKMLFWKQIWISVLLDNVTSKSLKHKQNTPLFMAKQTYSVQGSSNLDVPCKEFLLTSLSRLIQISMQSFITMLLLCSFKFQFQNLFFSEEFLYRNYALILDIFNIQPLRLLKNLKNEIFPNKAIYSSFRSVKATDFKNVI